MSKASRLRPTLRAVLLAAGALVASAAAAAQPLAFDTCTDSAGRRVASEQRFGLGRVAATERGPNGAPVIVYDPLVLAWLAPVTRLWLHAHECGHLALGHAAIEAADLEREADCWAARTLVAAGQLHPSQVATIQGDLAGLSVEDWRSLAGPRRDVPLHACMDEARAAARRRVADTLPAPGRP